MGIDKSFYKQCLKTEVRKSKNPFKGLSDSATAVLWIRKMQYYSQVKGLEFLSGKYGKKLIRNYGIFVHPSTSIGMGLKLPHPNGIIIGKNVVIGENVTIYQQVTFGSAHVGDWKSEQNLQPRVGAGSTLFAGAKIIGNIDLGPNTTVGANSVLTKSTEKDSVWAGVPARPIEKK